MTLEEARELEQSLSVNARRVFNCASVAIMREFADLSVSTKDVAEGLEAAALVARGVINDSAKERMN
jgi:hypothetical protein